MSSYLFILSPPMGGSTLLYKFLATSNSVSALHSRIHGTMPVEGLRFIKDKLHKSRWNSDVEWPWDDIKKIYDSYWDYTKPILLEKSPPNIVRAQQIEKHFRPAYFVLTVRNPYVYCASLIRRGLSLSASTEQVISHFKFQIDNKEKLENVLCFTYEEFTDNPQLIAQRIRSFIPQIGELDCNERFLIRRYGRRRIANRNVASSYFLTIKDIKKINVVFRKHKDVIEYWGYKISNFPPCYFSLRRIAFRFINMVVTFPPPPPREG